MPPFRFHFGLYFNFNCNCECRPISIVSISNLIVELRLCGHLQKMDVCMHLRLTLVLKHVIAFELSTDLFLIMLETYLFYSSFLCSLHLVGFIWTGISDIDQASLFHLILIPLSFILV